MLKCLCMVICERRSQDRVFNQVAKASGTTPEMKRGERSAGSLVFLLFMIISDITSVSVVIKYMFPMP